MNYGWKGKIQEFLQIELKDFIDTLITYVYGSIHPNEWEEDKDKVFSQRKAWEDCFKKLQIIFQNYTD